MPSSDRKDDWRRRYYESLDEIDRREAEWRDLDELLTAAVLRLSHLAEDPGHPDLNGKLDRLRQAIKAEDRAQELTPVVAGLANVAMRSDQATVGVPMLEELADRLRLPKPFDSRLTALRAELAGLGAADGASRLIGLVQEVLDDFADRLSEESIRLVRNLFEELVERAITPWAPQEAKLLKERARRAVREDELHQFVDDLAATLGEHPADPESGAMPLHEVLIRLLERLPIPSNLADRVAALRHELSGGLPPDRLDATLSAIAELVSDIRSRIQEEKRDLETFLVQLTENLQELDRSVQATVANHRESFDAGRALDAKVSEQVTGIEDSVRSAEGIDSLKQVIAERVATIRRHMDEHREDERQRADRAEQEVKRLSERLAAVEAETGRLRTQVQHERAQALIDPLTGVQNRLAYDERMHYEYTRWRRFGTPLVLAVWDVDYFKEINDQYGHQAGDKVLRAIAKILSSSVREVDFVGRYGGEEFVMILPDTPIDGALQAAEKLRIAVETAAFRYRDQHVRVTISCGLAQFGEGDEPDSVFARADAALYRAKDGGRNRCVTDDAD